VHPPAQVVEIRPSIGNINKLYSVSRAYHYQKEGLKMEFYILESRTPMQWGDYAHQLVHGMAGLEGGRMVLERTGPFIPPITLPNYWSPVLVTDAFRKELEASGLTGFAFGPVEKKRIVRLDWEKWDLKAEAPLKYPSQGEPENYILGRKHSPKIADMLGDIWELVLEECADFEARNPDPETDDKRVHLKLTRWDGRDMFRVGRVRHSCVTEKAKAWLEQRASDWVSFQRAIEK